MAEAEISAMFVESRYKRPHPCQRRRRIRGPTGCDGRVDQEQSFGKHIKVDPGTVIGLYAVIEGITTIGAATAFSSSPRSAPRRRTSKYAGKPSPGNQRGQVHPNHNLRHSIAAPRAAAW